MLLSLALGGCAGLPFFGDRNGDEPARDAEPLVAQYELEVDAPPPLRALLLEYLDVSRFQRLPQSDAVTTAELDRLAAAAPAQARTLLETEGYFNAAVTIARSDPGAGLPRLTLTVVPGPQVRVERVAIDAVEPLAPRTATREEPWTDRLDRLRRTWLLPPGEPFRQPAWTAAKTAALFALRADGYPTASWRSTQARVDATDNTAALTLEVEGGPLYRLGEIRVEGASRFDESAVRRLATFFRGAVYSERLLLDYQDRLLKVGLYEGASVELDATGPPEAAPVTVRVKELTQHQATFGIGYSANTGPRVSVEHHDRKLFGREWISHETLALGPNHKLLGIELTSYPLEDLWRNLAAANFEQLLAADETRNSFTARVGRSLDTTSFERLFYAELAQARLDSAPVTSASGAGSLNYHWLRRDLDSVLQPTLGTALAAQGGIGWGSGREKRSDRIDEERAKGPFVRAFTRFSWYRPFGRWYVNARADAGQVFVHNRILVPDTILFRAGGDGSVRGYGYRTLGPIVNGAVVGGRVLATGSVEVEHPLTARLPALLGALFVDAGNAADRWTELDPVVGVGAGLHYRSPVGPLRLDVAWGHHERRVRLHLSVGVTFVP
ncbi:MAG: autotransporter assembly complex protein TamA [Caldimonas sp.]